MITAHISSAMEAYYLYKRRMNSKVLRCISSLSRPRVLCPLTCIVTVRPRLYGAMNLFFCIYLLNLLN